MRNGLWTAVLSGVSLLGAATPAGAAVFDTTLASRATGALGAKGAATSERPSISADGRWLAFQSLSTLTPEDTDAKYDVYVRDLQSGTTTLVSQAGGTKGNGAAVRPVISGDGRFVAFFSDSTNLHPDDTDTVADVYVRDLQAATTALASRADGAAGAKGNAESSFPAISATGRYVTFRSAATNLQDDTDATFDVFVRDLQASTTTLVSRAGAAGAKGNAQSLRPVISADGRYVAFESQATNLDPADGDALRDIFVRDLQERTTALVSRAAGAAGVKGDGDSERPGISADGRSVAFVSAAGNLHPDATTPGAGVVLVRNLDGATTTLASRASGAGGAKANNGSDEPAISPDGRFVTFFSFATNLDPDDTSAGDGSDVFMRDLQAATTELISRASGAGGVNGNNQSFDAAPVSTGGRVVAFTSSATNLHPDDTDTTLDVFARQVRAGDPAPDPVAGPTPVVSGPAEPGTPMPGSPAPRPTPTTGPTRGAVPVSFLVLGKVTVRRNRLVLISAAVSGAGTLKATATVRVRGARGRKLRSLTLTRQTRRPSRAGAVRLRLKIGKTARRRLLRARGRLKMKVTLRFVPNAGGSRTKSKTVTLRARKR